MIKLKDILRSNERLASWPENMSHEEMKFIKDNKLTKLSQLEEIILKGEEVPNKFIEIYELAIANIDEENLKLRKSLFYNNSLVDIINERDLEITEEETLVKSLILNAVIDDSWRVTFNAIEKLNIRNLRFFLNHVSLNGKNSLEIYPKIGDSAVNKVAKVLTFYEEQIKRQSMEKHMIGTNLFTLNQAAKRYIVERELNEFIDYLLSFPTDFVWGKRSPHINKLLVECLTSQRKNAIINRERLIETLTNYMTLEELENGAIENHTLDRFILEKTPPKSVK